MLYYRAAETEEECLDAMALATRIFAQSSNMSEGEYGGYKEKLWLEDPEYDVQNIVIALDITGKICGVIRIIPRLLMRRDQCFKTAGISSVCLDMEYRGKGYSEPFMRSALQICVERGYDISILFARRALDNYYNRFAYWGLSSYNTVQFANTHQANSLSEISNVDLTGFDSEDIAKYKKLHKDCYQSTFGYVKRSYADWIYIGKKLARQNGIFFKTVKRKGLVLGYFLLEENSVLEVAVNTDLLTISSIIALIQEHKVSSDLLFQISPDHLLMKKSNSSFDHTISFRCCPYGGHMVKILNFEKVVDLCADRYKRLYLSQADEVVTKLDYVRKTLGYEDSQMHDIDYETICYLLGSYSPQASLGSGLGVIDRLAFNVPYLDHL